MNKSIFVLSIFLSSPALSEINSDYNQEVYLAVGAASHKLESEKGTQYSAIWGARNYYVHNWFLGGELEASYIDNKVSDTVNIDGSILSATIEEQYAIAANMPIGMRFVVTGKVVVDLYGLVGFSMTRLKGSYNLLNLSSSDKKTIYGPKWGVGVDSVFSDYRVGLRWSRASLDGDDVSDSLIEENISLLVGYHF